jgi:hypothetical protein
MFTDSAEADKARRDDLLSVQQAAIYSKRSESSLRSKIQQGTLACERVGPHGSIVISKRVLDGLLFDGGSGR